MSEEAIAKKGYVYEFLDENENILYIGSTGNIANRMKQHFSLKRNVKMGVKEYDSVKTVQYAECDSRNGASIAEIYLIQKYHPCLNTEYSEWGETSIVSLDERKLKWESKTPAEFLAKPKKDEKSNKADKATPSTQRTSAVTCLFPNYHVRHGKESNLVKYKVAIWLIAHPELLFKNIGTEEEWDWATNLSMSLIQREFEKDGYVFEENIYDSERGGTL